MQFEGIPLLLFNT